MKSNNFSEQQFRQYEENSPNFETVYEYVKKYEKHVSSYIQEFISMCELIKEIKEKVSNQELKTIDFEYFCSCVNLDPYSSHIRKFIQVANNKHKFIDYLNILPPSILILSTLSTIDADSLDKFLSDRTEILTTKDVKEIKNACKKEIEDSSDEESVHQDEQFESSNKDFLKKQEIKKEVISKKDYINLRFDFESINSDIRSQIIRLIMNLDKNSVDLETNIHKLNECYN